MALLRANINGSWIDLPTPAPENYSVTEEYLENSSRDSKGYLHRDIIRKLRKVECGWNALNGTQMATLTNLYDYSSFTLEFTDNRNRRVQMKCYAGPISGQAKFMNPSTLQMTLRTGISMNFIEY